jgi:hypothetical protein
MKNKDNVNVFDYFKKFIADSNLKIHTQPGENGQGLSDQNE